MRRLSAAIVGRSAVVQQLADRELPAEELREQPVVGVVLGMAEPEREVEVDEDPLLTDPDQPRTTRRGRSLAWLTPDVIKASQQDKLDARDIYACPVYKTQQRGPTYVFAAGLKTKAPPAKWVMAGVSMLLDVAE